MSFEGDFDVDFFERGFALDGLRGDFFYDIKTLDYFSKNGVGAIEGWDASNC